MMTTAGKVTNALQGEVMRRIEALDSIKGLHSVTFIVNLDNAGNVAGVTFRVEAR